MAKHKDKDNVRTITTPSPYGSHSSMLVNIDDLAKNHNVPKDKAICPVSYTHLTLPTNREV